MISQITLHLKFTFYYFKFYLLHLIEHFLHLLHYLFNNTQQPQHNNT